MQHKIVLFFLMLSIGASAQHTLYQEKYRPQYHFSSQKNWINDPNGLVYHNGEYHLFFQHNPFANKWGHMSWGHAVSKDLISWKQLPVALKEENDILIFSGSVVSDVKNKSGFGIKKEDIPLVSIYTGHDSLVENQNLAYSLDNGRSWKKHTANPVLDLQLQDFRDPSVFWYEPSKKWIMAVSLPKEQIISFYSSFSLKQWTHESNFEPQSDISGDWECPDLFQVPVYGDPNRKKWVLFVSQNSTMQYFVGEFDGKKFRSENPYNKIMRPDFGADYYAAITYKTSPSKLPVSIGWVNNWAYANDIPTSPWRGAMSLPRQLSVKKSGNEWILIQEPLKLLADLRSTAQVLPNNIAVKTNYALPFKGQCFEMEFDMKPSTTGTSGLNIAVGGKRYFSIGYDASLQQLYIDRTNTLSTFSNKFPDFNIKTASLTPVNNNIHFRVFFDKSIVEVFANNGEVVFTSQVFPEEKDTGIAFFSDGNETIFENVWFWPMKTIWK